MVISDEVLLFEIVPAVGKNFMWLQLEKGSGSGSGKSHFLTPNSWAKLSARLLLSLFRLVWVYSGRDLAVTEKMG